MMKMVVNNSPTKRPPPTELATLLASLKMVNFLDVGDQERERLKHLLDLEHRQREAVRFGDSLPLVGRD